MGFDYKPLGSDKLIASVVLIVCGLLQACQANRVRSAIAQGNAAFEQKSYARARDIYRSALTEDVRSSEAWYRLGLTHEKLKLPGDAREDYRTAFHYDGTNLRAGVKLADLDLAFYFSAPSRFEPLFQEAQSVITSIASVDPNSVDAMRLAGAIAANSQHYNAAIDRYQRAIKARPADSDLKLTLVRVLFAANRPSDAFALGFQVLDQDKSYLPMYDLLYSVFLSSKQPEQAEALLKRKIASNPTHLECWLQLANFYHETNREKEAEAIITKLATDHREPPEAHALAADYYSGVHRLNEAIFQHSILESANIGGPESLYRKQYIKLLVAQDRCSEAEPLLQKMRETDPANPDISALSAEILFCRPASSGG